MALSHGKKSGPGISPIYVTLGHGENTGSYGKGSDGHKTRSLKPEQAQEQARILQEGSGYEALLFAHKVPGADIPALQARVLAVGSPAQINQFARFIHEADVKACQTRILEFGSGEEVMEFARDILGADIAACQKRVLTVGDGLDTPIPLPLMCLVLTLRRAKPGCCRSAMQWMHSGSAVAFRN